MAKTSPAKPMSKRAKKPTKPIINVVDLKKSLAELEKSPLTALSSALDKLVHHTQAIAEQLKQDQIRVKKLEMELNDAHKKGRVADDKAKNSSAVSAKNAAKKAKTLSTTLNKNLQQARKALDKTRVLHEHIKGVKNKFTYLAKEMKQLARNWPNVAQQAKPNQAQKVEITPEA